MYFAVPLKTLVGLLRFGNAGVIVHFEIVITEFSLEVALESSPLIENSE